MYTFIIWLVSLIGAVVISVGLADVKYCFDEQNNIILKRGKGRQYDKLSGVVIAIVVALHSLTTVFILLSSESFLLLLMAPAFQESSIEYLYYFVIPLIALSYWGMVFVVSSSIYGLTAKRKHQKLLRKVFKNRHALETVN